MILHGDSLPDEAVVEADVCVVGGGPVGIQLARRLARRGIRVVVAESGEEGPFPRAQDLNTGTLSGRWAGELRDIRIRQLGGTMHVWGGNCRPLDPIDFEARPWVPDSGWPIRYTEIAPYMADAHDALMLDSFDYEVTEPLLVQPPEEAPAFEEIHFRLSRLVCGETPRHMGEFTGYLHAEMRAAANPRYLVGVTVCQILLTADRGSIEGLFAMTFQGKALHLRARAYVLATGGIETARLLLASREDMACGVGNRGDSVGRYFMEHPHGLGALLLVRPDRKKLLESFSPGVIGSNSVVQRRLRLTDATQRRLQLLNLSFQIVAQRLKPSEQDIYSEAFARAAEGVEGAESWLRYYVVFLSEQAPNRESRVTLGEQTDFFGIPQADLCWQVTEQDHHTVAVALDLLRRGIFNGDGLHMVPRIAPQVEDWVLGWGAHHLGTTRMSLSPRDGVVDRDCRIHDLSNGFCAGSSIFATGGMANPLLASIGFALRLADHLAMRLRHLPVPAAEGRLRRPLLYTLREAG